jgi:flagellar basal-body rod protein FlgB
MISALFEQPNYVAAKKLLDATVMRHEAIASNIANLETPGYKRLDVAPSFTAELKNAISSRDPSRVASAHPQLAIDATAVATGPDGNTVQLEKELAELSKNSLSHALEAHLVTGSLLRLRLAISGRA